jgi:transcriptional regulator with XRE-family HTH domain
MKAQQLKSARREHGWSEVEAARRLGVSQSYLSMLETGERRLTPSLARKAMRVYNLSFTVLPLDEKFEPQEHMDAQRLTNHFSALGYPGFEYLRPRVLRKNPGEVLLAALAQDDLEARLVEALPWLLLRHWEMDVGWLTEQARKLNLQNRLGFVVSLARRASEGRTPLNEQRNHVLSELESTLDRSRLVREGTFLRRPRTDAERQWLVENRSEEAKHWNLLTDWRPEHLQYVV